MIDRLREQIQERLDQLASEADRLRKALVALGPRYVQGHGAQASCAEAVDEADGHSGDERSGPAAEHACDSLRSPDGARRDQGRRARRARRRRGDDRRRGGDQGRPRPSDRLDDALEARQDRRSGESAARLPARVDHARGAVLARRVATRRSLLFTPGGRRYRRRHAPARVQVRRRRRDRRRRRSPRGLPGAAARPAARCDPVSRSAVSIRPSGARGSARAAGRRSRRCSPISSSARSRRSCADRAAQRAIAVVLPLIRRSAVISPTCPTACASCDRQAGSR